MREGFLRKLACPYCGGELVIGAVDAEQNDELWEGALDCAGCETSFAVKAGMPFLYRDDASWEAKAREAAGWVALHKKQGIYEPTEEGIDLQIPYYPEEPWIGVAHRFDAALERLELSGTETVLDLGAGRGWAAKYFARIGCETVALDVTADENIGLGRGRALMEHAGVYFERVIGDGENLPFQADTFDLVFCSAALHHSSNLSQLLESVHKVLKSGGRLCAIREPSLSVLADEADELARDAAEEAAVGINETRPRYNDYLTALRHAGLQPSLVIPAPALDMNGAEVEAWARDLGVLWATPDWRHPRRSLWRLWSYGGNRLRAVLKGKLAPINGGAASGDGHRALAAVAKWYTVELFILAEKGVG